MSRGTELLAPDGPGPLPNAADGLFRLRILATSDLHVHITPWDYYADRRSITSGLARTATLIAAARAQVQACLLLDNGDFLQGSPMGEFVAQGDGPPPDIHPMIAAMNALGYDAATLGNHEFSNGLPFLMRQLTKAAFPVVSANIAHKLGATPLEDAMLVPPAVILDRIVTDCHGNQRVLRIGIIGLMPPQTTQWDHQQLGNALITREILETAAAHVPKLRCDGADIVIALSHSGIGAPEGHANSEEVTADLAALSGIDALVAGHTHQTFPSTDFSASAGVDPVRGMLWGKPAVMPGFHGSHLGVIDLELRRRDGRWQVAGSRAELRPISRRTKTGRVVALTRPAPAILAIAKAAHLATRQWAVGPLGHTNRPLHSYFSLVAPCPTVRLIGRAQADHVTRALQGGPYAGLPVISAAAPFHAGGRGGPDNYTVIPAGPLVMRHAFDLYPHPNTIAALLVTGAEVADWLERSFSLFHSIRTGAVDARLIDTDFPSFNFDLLEGVSWEVDLTAAARFDSRGNLIRPTSHRIVNLCRKGVAIVPTDMFVLATNSYRAAGSGGFAGAASDRVILSGRESSRDVVLAHISGHDSLPDTGPPNWRFVPMPDTTAVFVSAPAAADHIADLAAMAAQSLDMTATGFRRFRLHL